MKNSISNAVNNDNNDDLGKAVMRAENLYFKYRKRDDYIIRGASFSIREGMLYGMVGKNSTGKSTLLKLLCGRENKHGGEITLDNHTDIIYLKKNVGIVSEEQKLFKELTVYENGVLLEKCYEGFKIEEFLNYINMYKINRNDRIDALSASDKIKVKISLVLARHVKVMLLDEPTGVLDVSAREDFMKLLRDITIEKNMAVIMATHLTDDLDRQADYIIFVNEDGTVEADDREELNDKYMLLRGSKEDMAKLPEEAILSCEEKATSVTAMTACFDSIRDKVENSDIVTEIPDISAVMYYKDKANSRSIKVKKEKEERNEIKMVHAKSNESTYREVAKIYNVLIALYGRRWVLAGISIILYIGFIFIYLGEEPASTDLTVIVFWSFTSAMFIDSCCTPKIIDKKELYGELKFLPVKTADIFKYVISKIAGVLVIAAALLLITMLGNAVKGNGCEVIEKVIEILIIYAVILVYNIIETAVALNKA